MRIRELRNKIKCTQEKLSEILDVSQQNISKYENGKLEPDINTLIQIADYFNVSIDYLVERTDTNSFTSQSVSTLPILSDKIQNLIEIYSQLDSYHQGALMERARTMLEEQLREDSLKIKTPIEGA